MNEIKIFKTAHEYVLWQNETVRNLYLANFVCYFIDEEHIQIIKDRYDSPFKTVDYSQFLGRLKRHDETIYMEYFTMKLSEISKKYNVAIITGTQLQNPDIKYSHTGGEHIKYPTQHIIHLDYINSMR